jgi:hypothetical protein
MRARIFLHFWYTHITSLSRVFPDLYSTTRSFISPASFNIFNRLCDTLLLLVLAYAKYYPEHPFCPWLMGTEFIEHFFGLARSLLPNFTFAELLKMVKHTMLHQRLLLSGKFNVKKERSSRAGYILDYDATPLTEDELLKARVDLTILEINQIVELAHKEAVAICKDVLHMPVAAPPLQLAPLSGPTKKQTRCSEDSDSEDDDWEGDSEDGEDSHGTEFVDVESEAGAVGAAAMDAARYANLCEEYETTLAESRDVREHIPPILPPLTLPPAITTPLVLNPFKSEILDDLNRLSIDKMVSLRRCHQSGTSTRSERSVRLDPKFITNINKPANDDDLDKDSPKRRIKELSHRVRIAQDLDKSATKPKTAREIRWQTVAKEIGRLVPQHSKQDSFRYSFELFADIIISQHCPMSQPKISIHFSRCN